MSKIYLNQSSNRFLTEEKKIETIKKKNRNAMSDYSQTIDDVFENLEGCNVTKKRKVLALIP